MSDLKYIIDILGPWRKKEEEEEEKDKELFGKIIGLLDFNTIDSWTNDISNGRECHRSFHWFDEYKQLTKNPTNQFFRKKLNDSFLKMNKSLFALLSFVVVIFFQKNYLRVVFTLLLILKQKKKILLNTINY